MGTKVCGTKCAIHVRIIEKVCSVVADNYCDLWSRDGVVIILTMLSLDEQGALVQLLAEKSRQTA